MQLNDRGITVRVIADSIRPDCSANVGLDAPGRIITIVMRYPRWIHSEFMTHRDRARNAASSRAVSVKKSMENCTFRPVDIPSEQKGMQGGDKLGPLEKDLAYRHIDELCDKTLDVCNRLIKLGVHKSIINRYLEPFAYIEVVCTATRWNHFLGLRCAPDAEPHFNILANLVKASLESSVPVPRWFHTPFVADGYNLTHMRISAARCAGISYQRPDFTEEKELAVCDDLVTKRHSSPLEHPAYSGIHLSIDHSSGPIRGWQTLRSELKQD